MAENMALIFQTDESIRSYPNTLQRLARHFWYADKNAGLLELADELEQRPEISVLCITDENRMPIGIIKREELFLRLGKRFGREILSKDSASDSAETAWVYPGGSNIFYVLEHLRGQAAKNKSDTEVSKPPSEQNKYLILVDSQKKFSGMLSLQDVASFMVELTNEDIALASLLQERFLLNADALTQFEVKVDSWWSSAKGIGGDFYFIRKIDNRKFFATLCDVSGKGVAAALVVSIVWGFLRAYTMRDGLRDLLVSLNSAVLNSFHREKYLTGFFLFYDTEQKILRVADMGHSHTLFLREGQSLSLNKTRVNLPLGIDEDIEPSVYSFPVRPGDTLLIYSDGIPEQDNPMGKEFGEERLLSLLTDTIAQGKTFSDILPKTLEQFRQHTPQRDDMTFLMLRF